LSLIFIAFSKLGISYATTSETPPETLSPDNTVLKSITGQSDFWHLSHIALGRSPEISIGENEILIESNELKSIKAERGISADISGTAGYIRQFVTSNSLLLDTSLDAQSQISIRKNLFDGGNVKYRSERQSRLLDSSKYNLSEIRKSQLDRLAQIYTDVARLRETIAIRDIGISNLERQFRNANLSFKIGDGTRTDIEFAASQLAFSRQERALNIAELEISLEIFRQEFGFPAPSLSLAITNCARLPDDFKEFQILAVNENPQMFSALSEEEAVSFNTKIERSRFGPRIDLETGIIGRVNDFGGLFDRQESIGVQGRINFVVPLYTSGQRKSAVETAALEHSNAIYRRQRVQRQLEETARREWYEFQALKIANLEVRRSVKAAELALRGANLEKQEGLRSDLDVLDAERALLESKLSQVTLMARLKLSSVRLTTSIRAYDCFKF